MATYENRKTLACKPCNSRSTGASATTSTEPKDLATIKCGKDILSITKVGDKAIVMYDDCSYSTVSVGRVDVEAFLGDRLVCMAKAIKEVANHVEELDRGQKETAETVKDLLPRITALEEKEDKDTIYDDTEVRASITSVEQTVNELLEKAVTKDQLIIVENLEGTQDLFKAFPLEV